MRSDNVIQHSGVKRMMKGKDFRRQLYEMIRAQGEPVGSFKDFRKKFAANREEYVKQAVEHARPKISAYVKGPFVREFSSKFGILCLTEIPDSILMWSHYSSGHTGIALGIEIPPHWKMLKVKYSNTNTRVSIRLVWPEDPIGTEETSLELVRTKSKHWAYEEEWRALSPLEKLQQEARGGRTLYFATIRPEIVKEIILGLRFPEQHMAEIRALCKGKFPQAQLLQASLHESYFALVMKQLA